MLSASNPRALEPDRTCQQVDSALQAIVSGGNARSTFCPAGITPMGDLVSSKQRGRYPRAEPFREAEERSNRSMHLIRFVRRSVSFAMAGLIAIVLGCSGERQEGQAVTPPDKEASKKIAAEMYAAQKERMKAMGQQK